ncbi:MAG TPA: hypothetical protein VF752_15910 [Thermoleophilaceae bacterium]
MLRVVGTWTGRVLLMLAGLTCGALAIGFAVVTVLDAMGKFEGPSDEVPGLPPIPVITAPLALFCAAFAFGCGWAFYDSFRSESEQPEALYPPL